ncbi:virulence factor MviN [Aquimarina sp. RZ0]|nr:virulence factor MviN [Aquimarina sp. RZ0]
MTKLINLVNTPIFINILTVGGITFFVKLLGFYKETLVVSTFGLSSFLDAFLLAVLIPTFIQTVFIGALRNIFIPNYITELKTTNKKSEFQSMGFIMVLGIVSILTIFAIIFSLYFLEMTFPGRDDTFYELIRKQLYVVLPCILFWGLSSILGGLLEVANKYFFSTISASFMAVSTIICLLFFSDVFGELVLALGLLIGSFCSFLYLLIVNLHFGLLSIHKPQKNDNVKAMMKQLPPKISSGLLTGLNTYVDQFFAAQLAIGSIAAVNYGIKIPSFLVSILMIAIGNVLLPHFARIINDNLQLAYKQLFKILKIVFFLGLGVGAIGFLFSEEIIFYLFERKEFTSEDTVVVAKVQQIILIYLPFYLCTLVMVKFLTSYNKNVFMAWASFFNLILNFVLNMILIKKFGLYGLVMSTTFVYVLNSFIYFTYTYKTYRKNVVNSIDV